MNQRGSSWKSHKAGYVQKFVSSVTWVIFRGVSQEIRQLDSELFLISP